MRVGRFKCVEIWINFGGYATEIIKDIGPHLQLCIWHLYFCNHDLIQCVMVHRTCF